MNQYSIILLQIGLVLLITFLISYLMPSAVQPSQRMYERDIVKVYRSLHNALQKAIITTVIIGSFLFLQSHFGISIQA